MASLKGYRSPCGPKRFRVLAETKLAGGVFVCEGLAKPVRRAYWRLVSVWPRETLAPFASEREAREELAQAKAVIDNHLRGERVTDEMCDRVKDAKTEVKRTTAVVRELIACVVDPALGFTVIPGDCPDVDFVNAAGTVLK